MTDEEEREAARRRAKEIGARWNGGASKKNGAPPDPTKPAAGKGDTPGSDPKKPRSTLDDLDAYLAKFKEEGRRDGTEAPSDLDRMVAELEGEESSFESLKKRAQEKQLDAATAPKTDAQVTHVAAPKPAEAERAENEEEDEFVLPGFTGDEKPSVPKVTGVEEDRRQEELLANIETKLDEALAERAEEQPPEPAALAPPPVPPRAAPERGLPPLDYPGSGRVNGGRVNGGRVNGGRVNGGRVNGGRVNGGRVNGGRVNGGRVNGGRVNGGRVNGGRVNGGRVNGGLRELPALQRRATLRQRVVALTAAIAVFGGLMIPVYLITLPPAVQIDGAFSDWSGYPLVTDAAADQVNDPSIDIVGFAARADERNLFLYVQVTQQGRIFQVPSNPLGAISYSFLLDTDADAATGYVAFGLGVDYLVVLTGSNGSFSSRELMALRPGATDRTDASQFTPVGSVQAAGGGNQLEVSMRLGSVGLRPGDRPLVLVIAQDSLGQEDVGDALTTTKPGVLKLRQEGTLPSVIPLSGEVRLFDVSGAAEGGDVRLLGLNFLVESPDGGGVLLTRVTAAGTSEPLSATAFGSSAMQVTISTPQLQLFADKSPSKTLSFYGRGTGPNGSAVRVYLRGSADVHTSAVSPDTAGLGSVLAPARFSRAYVGAAPSTVKIDGAFGDWNQSVAPDIDPRGDVTSYLGASTRGGPNAAVENAALDIVSSRAEVSPSISQVSFFLEVAGSILSPGLLPRPAPLSPAVLPASSGPGAPEEGPTDHTATIFVDTDSDAATGWSQFAGFGVDATIEVAGEGGGYGRSPRQTVAAVSNWNPAAQSFAPSSATVAVAFNSSAMEAQVSFAAICGGPCPRLRYVFHMEGPGKAYDETTLHEGSSRALGDVLFFNEERTLTRNVYQGDANQPVLAFTVVAPSTNQLAAYLEGVDAREEGASAGDLPSLAVYRDVPPTGSFDGDEVASAPLAAADLTATGRARLEFAPPIELAPGATFSGLVTVAVAPDAMPGTRFSLSIAGERGLRSNGVLEVIYGLPTTPEPIRILSATSGSRAQNDLKLNEVNVSAGWVEIYDTTGASTSLTNTSTIGIRVYQLKNSVFDKELEFMWLTGSTNSSGFAALDIPVVAGSGSKETVIELRCNNCSAGGGDNSTYMDRVILPQGATVQWGRSPDGTGTWQSTTNTTRGTANSIPEFSDIALPGLMAAFGFAMARTGRRRPPLRLDGSDG